MRYAKIRKQDISNGPGVRVSLFTQGCTHHCVNCFNPETWDMCGGKEWTKERENRVIELCNEKFITGLSILGGDPFSIYESNPNDSDLYDLLKRFKKSYPEKSIWLWTGYTWDQIIPDNGEYELSPFHKSIQRILPFIDVIVDGEFVEELKDMRLDYAGSSNQRVINVKQSLNNKTIIEMNK